jgi:hypothetical protein
MQALAEDHLNDILSNVVAAITAAVASLVGWGGLAGAAKDCVTPCVPHVEGLGVTLCVKGSVLALLLLHSVCTALVDVHVPVTRASLH